MDFDQVATFLEVAKLRSFSRAGRKVYRSQSAVSAQVRQLEHEYGERLLDRSGKSVQLTDAGKVFLEYAEAMLKVRRESLVAVADHGKKVRGVLTIGANEGTCLYVLPEVITQFSHKFPDVQLSIYRNFTRKIVERLEEGELDIGIVTLPVKSLVLKTYPIFNDDLLLMVSAQHPLAKLKSVPVAMVAQQPIILPKSGYTRQLMDKLLRPYASSLQVRMELPSVGMIKSFVMAGLGVSLISASFAQEEVRSGKLRLLPITDTPLSRKLGVAHRRNVSLTRAASAFLALVRKMHRGE